MSWFRRSAVPRDDDELVALAVVPLWQSEILRTALQEEGVQARIHPSFDVVLDGLTNARVWVHRRDLAEARRVLARFQGAHG